MMIKKTGTSVSIGAIPVLTDKRVSYPKPKPPGPNDYLVPILPPMPRD